MNKTDIQNAVSRAAVVSFQTENNPDIAERFLENSYLLTDLSDSSLKLVEFCLELEEAPETTLEFSDVIDTQGSVILLNC